jgi:ABC-2 type transport system ATP-binding protein
VSSTPRYAIETRYLRKVFNGRAAVQSLSLGVPPGEIFGFLGPNGAGKSTSIKMLLGLVRPTTGHAFVLGAPAGDVEVRRRIGFLPEDFRFYDWLTARELLQLHGRLSGMSPHRVRERVPAMLELVGLTAHGDRRLRTFSKGMLQRVGLAQALVHEPDVVFLDEPTSGLDPMGRRMVRDILRAERQRGATVFLNSHFLSEIEITCDHVAFIKAGEVVATRDLSGSAPEARRVVVHAHKVSPQALSGLETWAQNPQLADERLTFAVPTEDVLPDIIRHLVTSGADVFHVAAERVSLEDLFVSLMGEDRAL